MVAYIDTKFLDAINDKYREGQTSDIFQDFWKFMITLSNVDIKINITNPIDYFNNPVYKKLTNGSQRLPTCIGQFQDDIFDTKKNPYKLFLIERDFDATKRMRSNYGILVFNSSEIEELWQIIMNFQESSPIEISPSNATSLINWQFIEHQLLPCNCLSISDRYALRSAKLVRENIIPLIENFINRSGDNMPFFINVYTDGNIFFENRDEVIEVFKELQLSVKDRKGTDLEIIIHDIGKKEHQRLVFSNYQLISPGTSFDFISNGRVVTHEWMHVSFLFNKRYTKPIKEKIQRFHDYRTKKGEYARISI